VIVWINGAFGVGKTTTARQMAELRPELRLFDPEWVGYLLTSQLQGIDVADFQDLPAWRDLVPRVARHVADISGQHLVAVQTVLDEQYWTELGDGLNRRDLGVFQVVLDADEQALRTRILSDDDERSAQRWRLDHLAPYAAARPWLLRAADLVVDTTAVPPDEVARRIVAALPA